MVKVKIGKLSKEVIIISYDMFAMQIRDLTCMLSVRGRHLHNIIIRII